ncbi:hypothetical protein Q8A73_016406 [Channa argus]|nr:hypothetical protein Q8A73_016406 [Channa argus]
MFQTVVDFAFPQENRDQPVLEQEEQRKSHLSPVPQDTLKGSNWREQGRERGRDRQREREQKAWKEKESEERRKRNRGREGGRERRTRERKGSPKKDREREGERERERERESKCGVKEQTLHVAVEGVIWLWRETNSQAFLSLFAPLHPPTPQNLLPPSAPPSDPLFPV